MAGLVDAAKNQMLNALDETPAAPSSGIAYVSLHTADPGTSGTSEVSGGSPAYARKAITWGAAATSSKAMTGTNPVFDVPASTTITYVGFWSAVTAGTFFGSASITSETFGSQGTYTLTGATISLT